MDTPLPSSYPPPLKTTHWPSVWQLGLTALALAGLWSLALTFLLMGAASIFSASGPLRDLDAAGIAPMFLTGAAMALGGALLLPSILLALARLAGWSTERITSWRGWRVFIHPALLLVLLPLVLLAGWAVSDQPNLSWLLLPPLHLVAVGIPVVLTLSMTRRGLPLGSPQRAWGVFSSGLVLGPALILLIEGFALVLAIVVVVLIVASQPELARQLEELGQFGLGGPADQEEILERFAPVLLQPVSVLGILSFFAVVVPLIEELLKPIGVWLLVGRRLTPAEGFAAGALSGAGYALFESLLLAANPGQSWVTVVIARIGTAFVHILTTSLMGWALARAWEEGRYFRLGLTYLTAVVIHALWNTLSVSSGLAGVVQLQDLGETYPYILNVGLAAPLSLFCLALGVFVLLRICNGALRRALPVKPQPEAVL